MWSILWRKSRVEDCSGREHRQADCRYASRPDNLIPVRCFQGLLGDRRGRRSTTASARGELDSGLAPAIRYAPYAEFDFHSRSEQIKDRHEPVNGETAKVSVADTGEVGSRNTRAPVRGPHGQPLAVHDLDDLGGEDRLELFGVRVLVLEVAEHVAAAAHDFQFFLHRNISFNLLRRSLIRSISCLGVLMPFVDFFWECMDDPDVVAELHRVDHPEGVPFERQRNLEYAGAQTQHRLCEYRPCRPRPRS